MTIPEQWKCVGEFLVEGGLWTSLGVLKSVLWDQGRFREEENHLLALGMNGQEIPVLRTKIFYGRPPHYRPWVELFDLRRSLFLPSRGVVEYFGSDLERALLAFWGERLPPGSWIFVEYAEDILTDRALRRGIPPPFSRLGALLVQNGFLWLKDWYFAEGLREGGVKLQGEKPISDDVKKTMSERIYHLAHTFLRTQSVDSHDEVFTIAAKAARRFLRRFPL